MSLLHEDLSYILRGCAFEVRKALGLGHKEIVYQNAYEEMLKLKGIPYKREHSIRVYFTPTRKNVGTYRPDFIVKDLIIVEMKAMQQVPQKMMKIFYDYVRNTKYELGLFMNFGGTELRIKRAIFTNDRKTVLYT